MVHFEATAEQQEKAGVDEAVGALSFKTISHLLEECRMVLPGIQALFGFQLIAVFNQPFWDRLDPSHRSLHFTAIFLVVISMALVMTPAAYHRQVILLDSSCGACFH